MSQTDISVDEDRATLYARAVCEGREIAGPQVRDACARHLRDLEHGAERGLVYDQQGAARAIGFFEDVLCLNGGRFEGKPFKVLGWQAFVLGSLFGWKHEADGLRRFRVAYIETAKGSGKSPLAAGIGLYGLTADGEPRAEIYSGATKKDQAQILFRDAVAMVDQSPLLRRMVEKSGAPGKEWNLAFQRTASFFRPISADEGQSGPRPHIGLLDEIHEHRNAMVVEMMRAGTKSRDQALIFMITNSGSDRRGVCYDYHEYSEKVAAGQLEDDSFFGFVCGLDESDDPLNDEACWAKANPSLQEAGIPGLRYLREQVTQARGIPAKEALVKRLNFCVWTESSSPWITADVWLAAREATEIPWEAYYGRRCYGGLDLSSTQDLTSLVLLFEPDESDPYWRLKPWFWLPGDDLKRKEDLDRVPYTLWRSRGYLEALPGRAIDKLAILRRLLEISEVVDLAGLAYDRWRIQDLIMLAQAQGIELPPMTPFGQGFKEMAPALDVFEQLLLNEQLRHDGNPVMTWCASNAVTMSDPAGNRKVSKERARGRVDGIVASIMAAGMSAPMHSQREWSLLESLSDDDILVM